MQIWCNSSLSLEVNSISWSSYLVRSHTALCELPVETVVLMWTTVCPGRGWEQRITNSANPAVQLCLQRVGISLSSI